jgi:hypothetical protein
LFTADGASQLIDGLKEEAKGTWKDDARLQHFGAKTTVSVGATLLGIGLFTKAGKVGEVLDEITDKVSNFLNPRTVKAIEELKNEIKYLPENKSKIPEFLEVRANTENFLKKTEPEILDDLGEDLSKIVSKGENYNVLSKARNLPGTSKGVGKEIKGQWLKGTDGNAGLFPKTVADKLKGKSYPNFDEFRKDFWKTVATDDKLSKQLNSADITRMKQGLAPYAKLNQQIGGQKNYILHHKTPINQGGGVFDMDNLYIVTPRFHKEILDPKYHYGYGY